jgi:hypothetical protein
MYIWKIDMILVFVFLCMQNRCVFWHWELEYVQFLVENNVLRGEAIGDIGAGAKEEKVMKNIPAVVDAVNQMLVVMKIELTLLSVMYVFIILKK